MPRQVVELTTEHYLFDCPMYQEARTDLFNQLSDMGIDTNNKEILLEVVLHGKNTNAVVDALLSTIFTYLRATQRFR